MSDYPYIYFEKVASTSKTDIYELRNERTDSVLGVVQWYGSWRQYCFFPKGETIFNKGCLSSILDFLTEVNKIHYAKRNLKRDISNQKIVGKRFVK